MRDLSKIFKAYDVRGVVPDELDADVARALGSAFARWAGAPAVLVARDMRDSGPGLVAAFTEGATAAGVDVVDAGLASTDMAYFGAGSLDLPAAMFTASHNPARYNGIKLCRAGAAPVGQDSGLAELRAMIEAGPVAPAASAGSVRTHDLLSAYSQYLRGLVDVSAIRPLTVVVDAGNGMGGHTVPTVLAGLPLRVVPMYFELDGSFPHHEANPIEPANLRDLQARVLAEGADLGLAFDGDADRCFVVDERGAIVSPSTLTALIAVRELARRPGSTVIHNLITSRAVPEIVSEHGGVPVRTRVGHSFIKGTMAETGAIFGGEHSGHFYFADFWRADSGMLAALHVLAALGAADTTLSQLLAEYSRYPMSGEINTEVADPQATLEALTARYRDRGTIDSLDGLTVDLGDGAWFNVRPSNTEPLLRLNAEAHDTARLDELTSEVRAAITAASA